MMVEAATAADTNDLLCVCVRVCVQPCGSK